MKPNRLTLEQIARIADAVLRDPNVTAAALAHELGTNHSTTWDTLNRLPQRSTSLPPHQAPTKTPTPHINNPG